MTNMAHYKTIYALRKRAGTKKDLGYIALHAPPPAMRLFMLLKSLEPGRTLSFKESMQMLRISHGSVSNAAKWLFERGFITKNRRRI